MHKETEEKACLKECVRTHTHAHTRAHTTYLDEGGDVGERETLQVTEHAGGQDRSRMYTPHTHTHSRTHTHTHTHTHAHRFIQFHDVFKREKPLSRTEDLHIRQFCLGTR